MVNKNELINSKFHYSIWQCWKSFSLFQSINQSFFFFFFYFIWQQTSLKPSSLSMLSFAFVQFTRHVSICDWSLTMSKAGCRVKPPIALEAGETRLSVSGQARDYISWSCNEFGAFRLGLDLDSDLLRLKCAGTDYNTVLQCTTRE